MNKSQQTIFWLQEYVLELRASSKSAKSASSIEKHLRDETFSGDEMPSLHSVLVDAILLLEVAK